jgi:two-component system sensor histidine kinase TctE
MACLLVAAGVKLVSDYLDLARAQDHRLTVSATSTTAGRDGMVWRLSRPNGERIEGEAAVAPYPWLAELDPGGAPSLYYAHIDGRVLRAAAALRPAFRGGEAVMLQVAEPVSRRLPDWRSFLSASLLAFAAGVVSITAVAAVAALRARRWIVRALSDFESGAHDHEPAPAELRDTLDHMRDLQQEQRVWVDEQRRFLADAAHQLRTPMAVLRTQLQSALASEGDPRPVLSDMVHTVDRATGLANQLLSLTRIEQLKRTGRLETVAIAAAVREAVVELSPLVGQKRLDFALEGDGFDAEADVVMLGELLRNLLANAIHHSPRGSRIGVVLRGPPFREVVVWDEGPGVDDELKPRLFTPFSAAQGGVGLGLSICQQIAEAMGAGVRLFNRIENGRVVGVDAVLGWRRAQ